MKISNLDKIAIEHKDLRCIAFEEMEKKEIKVTDPVTGEVSDSFEITDKRYVPGRWIFDPNSGYFIEVKPARIVDKLASATMDAMGLNRRRRLDATPVALPVGFVPPDPLEVRIARLLGQGEFQRFRQTPDRLEDYFDLDVPDDPVDPLAPSDEVGTDPRIASAFKTHEDEMRAMFEGKPPTPTKSAPVDNPGKNKGKSKPVQPAQDPAAGDDVE